MRKVFSFTLSLVIVLTVIVFLESGIVEAVNTIEPSVLSKKVPFRMEPGTVLVYNDDFDPIIIEGGYVKDSFTDNKYSGIKKPRVVEITKGMNKEEIKQVKLENRIAKDAYLNGIHVQTPETKIYKGMKVVYDEYTGEISNIYYVDENEPSGYSIHNRPDKKVVI